MSRGHSRRGELVLSMTLAETFLLLLIVGWYGMRLESESGASEPPTPEAVLRADLRRAQEATKAAEEAQRALERQVSEHKRILAWVQEHFGGGPALDLKELQEIIRVHEDSIRDEARRGKPTCSPANVLVRVVSDDDRVALTLLEDFDLDSRRFQKGLYLAVEAELIEFLDAIDSYYAQRRQSKSDCAYDYQLAWRTDRDYRAARQRFEKYFYPARLTQLQ